MTITIGKVEKERESVCETPPKQKSPPQVNLKQIDGRAYYFLARLSQVTLVGMPVSPSLFFETPLALLQANAPAIVTRITAVRTIVIFFMTYV